MLCVLATKIAIHRSRRKLKIRHDQICQETSLLKKLLLHRSSFSISCYNFFFTTEKIFFLFSSESENNIADVGAINICLRSLSVCQGLHLEDPPKDTGSDLSIGGPGTKARSDRMRSAICIRARRRAVSVTAQDYRTVDYSTVIHNASF